MRDVLTELTDEDGAAIFLHAVECGSRRQREAVGDADDLRRTR
jgi:hypothetical protein